MSLSLKEVCEIYLEFSEDNLLSMVDQILKSPEFISGLNQLNPNQIKEVRSREKEIVKKIIKRETDYYLKKFKVKSINEFTNIFAKSSTKKLKDVRQKIAREVVKEELEKLIT